jgi:hypothetical protein
MSDATLYEETFNLTSTIADKYDRVTRVIGATHDASTKLTLDVNHELYPLSSGGDNTQPGRHQGRARMEGEEGRVNSRGHVRLRVLRKGVPL